MMTETRVGGNQRSVKCDLHTADSFQQGLLPVIKYRHELHLAKTYVSIPALLPPKQSHAELLPPNLQRIVYQRYANSR